MRELSADEVTTVLSRNGIGVLALLDGDQPYPLPMSFGYDGDRPLFVMQFGAGPDSRKFDCLEEGAKAGFTVYEETEPGTEWRSVVITGELREIRDEETVDAYTAIAANAEFAPDMAIWGVPLEDTSLTVFELTMNECTGRAFSMTR
ncbi:pyridoxamine 5'-phosphate oxidase family protein [Halorientalis brevis]|uniref:Pyridoxamine 5'-phosphate oxidase family protein n=1 Tax=Halorientalis brevis TaxID=1126241 RepID=A0ABD6CBK0_9EURY|nr:pyridoxamine 5'-phosphate oxidase family protein [Halorientalis brevis]